VTSGQNDLLTALFAGGARPRLEPYFRTVELQKGQVLVEPLAPVRHVYFPYSGIVAFSVLLKDGHLVQTGVVGRDGAVGALQALNGKVSPSLVIVQVPGRAAVVEAERVAELAQGFPDIRSLIVGHEQFLLSEVQLSAACNAVHTIQQRVCRWLLRMNDLVGTSVAVTQELLAGMIGVRRTSVTLAASSLQGAGVIKYRRGNLEIVDIDRLRQSSCECYETLRDYRRVMQSKGSRVV
jgi:CRP-like cAMP-binding protein